MNEVKETTKMNRKETKRWKEKGGGGGGGEKEEEKEGEGEGGGGEEEEEEEEETSHLNGSNPANVIMFFISRCVVSLVTMCTIVLYQEQP